MTYKLTKADDEREVRNMSRVKEGGIWNIVAKASINPLEIEIELP